MHAGWGSRGISSMFFKFKSKKMKKNKIIKKGLNELKKQINVLNQMFISQLVVHIIYLENLVI